MKLSDEKVKKKNYTLYKHFNPKITLHITLFKTHTSFNGIVNKALTTVFPPPPPPIRAEYWLIKNLNSITIPSMADY